MESKEAQGRYSAVALSFNTKNGHSLRDQLEA